MAVMKKRRTFKYESYGNVAYAPTMEGGTGVAQDIPLPRRRVQEQTQTLTRTHVQVREPGAVAPFGVLGFLIVGIFAAMLIFSYAQHIQLSTELMALESSYSDLARQNSSLAAQYEQLFDIASIEAAVAGTMVRPSAEQVIYLDLSQPDQVSNYGTETRVEGVAGLVEGISEIVAEIQAYFQQ